MAQVWWRPEEHGWVLELEIIGQYVELVVFPLFWKHQSRMFAYDEYEDQLCAE